MLTTRLTKGIPYAVVDGRTLLLDILHPDPLPEKPMPAVVEVHGGGWYTGDRDGSRNQFLAERGFFTASIDYRLSQEAIFPAQIHDVKAAIRWVREHAAEYGIDPDRIGAHGSSAGGHLVALLGTSGGVPELEGSVGSQGYSSSVQAVVDLCGPTDFFETGGKVNEALDDAESRLLGGPVADRLELARLANPITHIRPGMPAFLIIHSEDDEIVPFIQSVIFERALRDAGQQARLIGYPDGGHCQEGHWEQSMQTMAEFFEETLAGLGA